MLRMVMALVAPAGVRVRGACGPVSLPEVLDGCRRKPTSDNALVVVSAHIVKWRPFLCQRVRQFHSTGKDSIWAVKSGLASRSRSCKHDFYSPYNVTGPSSYRRSASIINSGQSSSEEGPPGFQLGIPSLQSLVVQCGYLKLLHENLGELGALQDLQIECKDERLESLPKSIGQLHSLEVLCVMASQLESLPGSLGQLHLLSLLRIGSNRVRSLPEELENLRSRKQFDVWCGNWETLPKS